jgi:hypothetical protein
MPSPLPTFWTADSEPPPGGVFPSPAASERRLQAISFFVVCLLGSAWGVKLLWNALRRDISWLPQIGYGRALGFTVLWGLLFVVVLTMISGARELMTPGAWRKQGWTYSLDDATAAPADARVSRRDGLAELRFELWKYAAIHNGELPPEAAIDNSNWQVSGRPGLRFLYVAGQSVEEAGRLLAFEPSTDSDERLVLLTNGVIGTMPTSEIQRSLKRVELADAR